jgi:hypothetical protein
LPFASQPDIDAWNALEGGASLSANTEIKVGIYGYDITCLAYKCLGVESEDLLGVCDLIDARGLDGLAFGVRFDLDNTFDNDNSNPYCAGFHNEGTNDTATCVNRGYGFYNYEW